MKGIRHLIFCLVFLMISTCLSCMFPKPNQIAAPRPILNNSGKYMSPYTQDATIAEWVDTGMIASAASAIGSAIGREAGVRLLSAIPIIGGIFGGKAGDAAGRAIAIAACGGMKKIQNTSDLSFNNLQKLATWLYVTKSQKEDYQKVLNLTCEIYPKLCKKYSKYIKKEYKSQKK